MMLYMFQRLWGGNYICVKAVAIAIVRDQNSPNSGFHTATTMRTISYYTRASNKTRNYCLIFYVVVSGIFLSILGQNTQSICLVNYSLSFFKYQLFFLLLFFDELSQTIKIIFMKRQYLVQTIIDQSAMIAIDIPICLKYEPKQKKTF